MKKLIYLFVLIIWLTGCNKTQESPVNTPPPAKQPTTLPEMMTVLNLEYNKQYTFKNYIATQPDSVNTQAIYNYTGVNGKLTFIEPDTVEEVYNGATNTSKFLTSDYSLQGCNFTCVGLHTTPNSSFIDSVSGYLMANTITGNPCVIEGGVTAGIWTGTKTIIEK